MSGGRTIHGATLAAALTAAIAAAPAAGETTTVSGKAAVQPAGATAPPAKASPKRVKITLRVKHLEGGRLPVGRRAKLVGRMRPFVPGQKVEVWFGKGGDHFPKHNRIVRRIGHRKVGGFHMLSPRLLKPRRYGAHATHHATKTARRAHADADRFGMSYPDIDPGDRGDDVRLFEKLLDRRGYFTPRGGYYNSALGRAVLAFRKVNGMARNVSANPRIYKKLAAGRGGFDLEHPGAGRHVEVDLSHQVLALARNGKARHIFHVSTGAPATPTITGHYYFYSRQPGYNSVGMYYSSYWHGGYAVHGYASVPTYPASHGCVRAPIPNAVFIYNWIRLGESIFVYY